MIRSALMTGAVVLLAAILGYGWFLKTENATLKSKAVHMSALLQSCAVRTDNILEDKESDAEIDNIDDLRGAASEWLRR